MTTIPGHNVVIQQSGAVSEAIQGTNTPKPNPEHIDALQTANAVQEGTTVQEFEEAERLKERKEKERQRLARQREKEKREQEQALKELDPDATGKILDTII
ncbi:MAG: hypothetical protein D3926_09135 [Desulfobacteraceae bacterium]|nr:MAG: hypothetical protein D3926_09135 [Desulfobacteraceae bacterium]